MANFPRHQSLEAFTGFLLRKVSEMSFRGFSERVARYDLHPMHFGMLNIIEAEEPVSQRELGSRTGIDPSSMVARMDVLEERGLIERLRGKEDRRAYEIRLSPQGRTVLKELRKDARAHSEKFFAPLTKVERATLHALLAKLDDEHDPRPDG